MVAKLAAALGAVKPPIRTAAREPISDKRSSGDRYPSEPGHEGTDDDVGKIVLN